MTGKSLNIGINPLIIKWARKSSGWSMEDIAKKLKTSKENYARIESGEKLPTFKQLEKMANYFKRPLSVFFLPEPPKEPAISTSFRILPKSEQLLTKELRLAIRKARYYQSIANELMRYLQINTKPKITVAKSDDNPIVIAQRERAQTNVSIDQQLKWRNAYEAFNKWRNAIEHRNILVFQFKFSLEDGRGFSLMDKEPPVIALNSSDNILARIFTLFHEYAHILLGIPEIYTGEKEIKANNSEVENWCNRFASGFLIPEKALQEDTDFQNFKQSHQLLPEIVENLSKKFKVSKHAVITKIRALNLIGQEDYVKMSTSLAQQPFEISGDKRFISPAKQCIKEKGKHFVSIVLESKERDFITTADMIDYLSVKLRHLDKIQTFVIK